MISHILAPKKYNFRKLSRTEFASVWKISNKMETNWESAINTHMVDNKAKNMWLPYGSLVAIFLNMSNSTLKVRRQIRSTLGYEWHTKPNGNKH